MFNSQCDRRYLISGGSGGSGVGRDPRARLWWTRVSNLQGDGDTGAIDGPTAPHCIAD